MSLFQLLMLDGKGKTSVLGVKAGGLAEARVAAVAYIADKPAVMVTMVSETAL